MVCPSVAVRHGQGIAIRLAMAIDSSTILARRNGPERGKLAMEVGRQGGMIDQFALPVPDQSMSCFDPPQRRGEAGGQTRKQPPTPR
jgi:hypothetical protein